MAAQAVPGEDGEATWTSCTSGGVAVPSCHGGAAVAAPPPAPSRSRPDSPDWRRLDTLPALSDGSLLDEVLASVLRIPAAAAWLFDRRPVSSLSAAAIAFLRDAPCYQDVVLPLIAEDLSLGAVSKGAVLGEEPSEMAGNQLMYMPCVVFDGLVCGTVCNGGGRGCSLFLWRCGMARPLHEGGVRGGGGGGGGGCARADDAMAAL